MRKEAESPTLCTPNTPTQQYCIPGRTPEHICHQPVATARPPPQCHPNPLPAQHGLGQTQQDSGDLQLAFQSREKWQCGNDKSSLPRNVPTVRANHTQLCLGCVLPSAGG